MLPWSKSRRLAPALLLLASAACTQFETTETPAAEPAATMEDTSSEQTGGEEIAPTETPRPRPDPASAADADVEFVRAVLAPNGSWTFHVTVRHPDTGWDDYADGWDVVTPDGTVLKPQPEDPFTRLLLHPHENEQPFTRSQRGIEIPDRVNQVTVRAHDLVDGFGGVEIQVDLTAPAGPGFEVDRQSP